MLTVEIKKNIYYYYSLIHSVIGSGLRNLRFPSIAVFVIFITINSLFSLWELFFKIILLIF